MMLALTIFEFFFGIERMTWHEPLWGEYRLQYGPLLYLNGLVFEIFVELGNFFNLYSTTT